MTDLQTLRQHQTLSRLLALARGQARALADDRIDQFLAIMEEREEVIAELVEIERTPPPVNVLPFPTISAKADDPDVQDAMRGLIRSILEQDDANEQTLREQMSDLQKTIVRLSHGQAAGRGYAAAAGMGRAVGYMDVRG